MKKNQNTERPSTAVKPLCWNCKYGITMFQQNKEIHSKEVEVIPPEESDVMWKSSTEQTNSMFLEHVGWFTTCTWLCNQVSAKIMEHMPDEILLHVPHVTECNRFEKETKSHGSGKDEATGD